jgi:NADPH:quinone reductase-like Zn-dependent oxidoreductase
VRRVDSVERSYGSSQPAAKEGGLRADTRERRRIVVRSANCRCRRRQSHQHDIKRSKGWRLKALGAHHVIDYKQDPNWGHTARQLTPEGAGFDFVIEVGGANTLKQSVAATKMEGIMAIVGIVGGVQAEEARQLPSLLDAWLSCITVRGIAVGSRAQLEDLIAFVESSGLKPVVHDHAFGLREGKEAYKFLYRQRNFGKVVIDCQKM